MSYDLITVLGPTAVGKTRTASLIADSMNCEIVSADSRQVYKRMDIGTGKDLDEFIKRKIKYHLIDIAQPDSEYNIFNFKKDFYKTFSDIISRNKIPLLVGGSGLYLSSILQNYDLVEAQISPDEIKNLNQSSLTELRKILLDLQPEQHNTTDLTEKERIVRAIIVAKAKNKVPDFSKNIKSLTIGIRLNRNEIKKRITDRLKYRLQNGMIEEVQNLIDEGLTISKLNQFGLEYKYISKYLVKELNYNDMFQKLNSAIHNFAKRQMTWFRKMEREGVKINWFEPDQTQNIIKFIKLELTKNESVA